MLGVERAFSSALSVANSMKYKQEEARALCFLLISLYMCSLYTSFCIPQSQDLTPHGMSTFFEGQQCGKNFSLGGFSTQQDNEHWL